MNPSTKEYLDALRQGDYLQVLDWLEFIVNHYSVSEGDADSILQLAIFELIHHDFGPGDFHHIKILYALLEEQEPPFVERVAYNATVLCNAAMQYMVYDKHDLLAFYRSSRQMEFSEIREWMQRDNQLLDMNQNSEELMKQYDCLSQSVSVVQKEAREVRDKIVYILNCRQLLQSYLEKLEIAKGEEKLAAIRYGLINSLHSFFMEKTVTTAEVMETAAEFISTLKEMDPFPWEKDYLDKLFPSRFIDNSSIPRFFKMTKNFEHFAVKAIGKLLAENIGPEVIPPNAG
ncbi:MULTISPECIES: helical bundle domain-containing protein [unclassified Legionella]|uniref:helical bundle domain-containing protein n=1 Tax=unclassified Legionella TaxID=2622702 RepID=UPI0010556535|nr:MULTISPECIES: helical bundle domain-containing protein [unclassified Legionella]MDI9818758.1 helical bundle domain-containing protein [Legionella sp. PL877]